MEAKHTKGPWNIDLNMVHYDPPHFDIRDKDGRRIGTVMGTYPMGPKTEEANARLISAAPELLEALEMAYAHIQTKLYLIRDADKETISSAIAKAKGEGDD